MPIRLLALLLAVLRCGSPGAPNVAPGKHAFEDVGQAFQAPDTTAESPTDAEAPLDAGSPPDVVAPVDPGLPPADSKPWDYLLPACGDQKVDLSQTIAPATVLLVMDRSESMKGGKWTDAQTAVASLLTAYGPSIRFGLLMFPQVASQCPVTPTPDVGFSLDNAAAVAAAMAAADLRLGTPTGAALGAAKTLLAAESGTRVVILATDGKPNCAADCSLCTGAAEGGCAAGKCTACTAVAKCVKAVIASEVTAIKDQGIPTYVVGLSGSGTAKDTLNLIAELGGTAKAGDIEYYEAGTGDELAAAFKDIAGSVTSCSAQLTPVPGYAFLLVELGGQKVAHDPTHQDGWDLLPGDVLQFYGPACTAASAEDADVSVTYVCKYADP